MDVSLTKDVSLLLNAIYSSFCYSKFYCTSSAEKPDRKPYYTLVLILHKKIGETKTLVSIREKHFEERKSEGRRNSRRLEFTPFKNFVSGNSKMVHLNLYLPTQKAHFSFKKAAAHREGARTGFELFNGAVSNRTPHFK